MTKILAVNLSFVRDSDLVDTVQIGSNRSLDDADIVLFQPAIGREIKSRTVFGDRAQIDGRTGREAMEVSFHWKTELDRAAKNGKTIVIFLAAPHYEVFPTGKTVRSTNGKTNQTVNISSYDSLPFEINAFPLEGKEIRLLKKPNWLVDYWDKFAAIHNYDCVINCSIDSILTTKSKDKVVGGLKKSDDGCYVLLPAIRDEIVIDVLSKSPEGNSQTLMNWQCEFEHAIISIHKNLHRGAQKSNVPDWMRNECFITKKEADAMLEIKHIETEVSNLENQLSSLEGKIEQFDVLKQLLYENGEQLEIAVRAGLAIFGFDVSHFQDGTYEFDVVFCSPEGRALGECEGKDNRAIKLEKIRQLHDNIERDYDLHGEEAVYAKPVLFGNAFRLLPVSDRPDFFSRHCLNNAAKNGVALVRTPDMYSAVKYLLDNPDDEKYKLKCRLAILEAEGKIVEFPGVKSV